MIKLICTLLFFLTVWALDAQTTKIVGKLQLILIDGPAENIPAQTLAAFGDNVIFYENATHTLTSSDTQTPTGLAPVMLGDGSGGISGISRLQDATDSDFSQIADGSKFVWDAGQMIPLKEGTILHQTDYTNSTTTFSTIPGYSFSGEAGESYWFEVNLRIAGNSSSDSRWQVNGSDGWFAVNSLENAQSKAPDIGTSSGNINLTNSNTTTGDEITIRGVAEFTTAGTLTIDARLNSGSNTLTIYGGRMNYEKIY